MNGGDFRGVLCSILRCPDCGGRLDFGERAKLGPFPVKDAALHCCSCGSRFGINAYVPRLLPHRISEATDILKERRRRAAELTTPKDLAQAQKWITQNLGVPTGELSGGRLALCREIATVLRLSEELGFDRYGTHEFLGILASHLMSTRYQRHVADQMYASVEAMLYEKLEDIILRVVVNGFLEYGPLIIVELGSGVGRLLHQYGSCISERRADVATPYRRHLPALYGQSSLVGRDKLKLVLGVDFEGRMIQLANRWLRGDKLYDLIETGRMAQILGSTLHMPLSFRESPYSSTMKVVCILFQTLGNQTLRELQVDMLRKAYELASPNGVVLVSAFNAMAFDAQAPAYYSSIERSVGPAVNCKNRTFLSSRTVYSKWFWREEFEALLAEAGFKHYRVWNGDDLAEFPEYEEYLQMPDQKRYKQRAIIGAACSTGDQLALVEGLLGAR